MIKDYITAEERTTFKKHNIKFEELIMSAVAFGLLYLCLILLSR